MAHDSHDKETDKITPLPQPELLSAAEAARLVGVGKRSWWRYASSGRAPEPIRFAGVVKWRRADISTWIAAGCPPCRPDDRR